MSASDKSKSILDCIIKLGAADIFTVSVKICVTLNAGTSDTEGVSASGCVTALVSISVTSDVSV